MYGESMVEMTLRCGERNSNGTRTLIFPQAFACWITFTSNLGAILEKKQRKNDLC